MLLKRNNARNIYFCQIGTPFNNLKIDKNNIKQKNYTHYPAKQSKKFFPNLKKPHKLIQQPNTLSIIFTHF